MATHRISLSVSPCGTALYSPVAGSGSSVVGSGSSLWLVSMTTGGLSGNLAWSLASPAGCSVTLGTLVAGCLAIGGGAGCLAMGGGAGCSLTGVTPKQEDILRRNRFSICGVHHS